jgi:hypothetical protein
MWCDNCLQMYRSASVVIIARIHDTHITQQNGVLTLVKRTGGDKTTIQFSDDDTFVHGITAALEDIHTTLWNEGASIKIVYRYIYCVHKEYSEHVLQGTFVHQHWLVIGVRQVL